MVLGLRIKGITRAEPVMPMWGYQSNFSGLHSLLSKVLGWCHTTRCFGRFRDALHCPDRCCPTASSGQTKPPPRSMR